MAHDGEVAAKQLMQPADRPMKRTGAIVIGGNSRGLGIVRSLGRHRIPVWVLTDKHRIATTSRYARHSRTWKQGDDAQQLDYLICLADKEGLDGWTLFPTEDEDLGMIARQH